MLSVVVCGESPDCKVTIRTGGLSSELVLHKVTPHFLGMSKYRYELVLRFLDFRTASAHDMHVYFFGIPHRLCQLCLGQWTVIKQKKQEQTAEPFVEDSKRCDCDFPLFSLLPMLTWFSCLAIILIWYCLFFVPVFLPLSLCLIPLPLSSSAHLPYISVSVQGCWRNTNGPGTGKNVNLRERCLLWVLHCWGGVFLLVLFLPCLMLLLLTGIYYLNFANFPFLPIVALCIDFYLCVECYAQTLRQFTSDFVQTSLWYLAVSLLFCRLNLVFNLWMQSWCWHYGRDVLSVCFWVFVGYFLKPNKPNG